MSEKERKRAGNPIIKSNYTADPSAHVWPTDPDRLYLYPSSDIAPPAGCDLMDQYHVYSTDNMVDWVDHGEILRRDDLSEAEWGPHYKDAFFMWAPDAAYYPNHPEGKGPYFFIFPHSIGNMTKGPDEWNTNWKLGIAYSDSPYQGFKDNEIAILKDKDGNEIVGDGWLIDPCLFKEGDDFYLVTGGSQEFRVAKLSPDLRSLAEDFHVYTQAELPHYHEGPWMFTRVNDAGEKLYYLMYPGMLDGEGDDMLYAISKTGVYGPWDYQGSLLKPVGTGDTSHGSIVEFKGNWYIFYHNAELSKGQGNLRSVCCDQLFFNPDGTIKMVEQTKTSVPAIGDEVDEEALDAKFGKGNYSIEEK
jgi:Glycosyl hydrolases family 43.